jgi:hypothetical protein
MEVDSFMPRPLYLQGKNPRYPSDRRLDGPQSERELGILYATATGNGLVYPLATISRYFVHLHLIHSFYLTGTGRIFLRRETDHSPTPSASLEACGTCAPIQMYVFVFVFVLWRFNKQGHRSLFSFHPLNQRSLLSDWYFYSLIGNRIFQSLLSKAISASSFLFVSSAAL